MATFYEDFLKCDIKKQVAEKEILKHNTFSVHPKGGESITELINTMILSCIRS